jgi:hypothetical protein
MRAERHDARRAMHGAEVIVAAPMRDRAHTGRGAHGLDQITEFLRQRRHDP